MTPTRRTLAHLRDIGYLVAIVERWNAHARVRQDLFGVIDVVALRHDHTGVLGVQCTSESNAAKRVTKIEESPQARLWVATGNRLEVWGWKKSGRRWVLRRRVILTEDFTQ